MSSRVRFVGLAILIVALIVAVLVLFLWAWACKEPHLDDLWVKLSYVLHQEWFVVPLVALIYVVAFLFARWHPIALPIRQELHSQIGNLRLGLDMEPPGDPEKQHRIASLNEMLKRVAARLNRIGPLDRILWTCVGKRLSARPKSGVAKPLDSGIAG